MTHGVRAGPDEAHLQQVRARQQTEALDWVYLLRPAVTPQTGEQVMNGPRHTHYVDERKRQCQRL